MFRPGTGLRTTTERVARDAGFEPLIGFETGNLERVLALVGQGLGVSLIPASSAAQRADVSFIRLTPALSRTVGLGWRRGQPLTPAARALRDALVSAVVPSGTAARNRGG